ncbi:NAD(P)-dependent oxidoreductase [Paenibacillus cellulositrophicus]|uniref:NAD(P)-dependent oxidoreductase n=1 Tax=Paenibacillus cellulositrophicus TaxID=562959 RepID=UPI00203D7C2F|nr:NAD(P)-dependent oxidoreductase [Paenibacillus cellulositrophicus]MCM2998499.1 NAD(P)-dependent oxidoreductase [Paenibacillus cellulositrophicus]
MTPIGFIGLGNMGQAMALNLIKAGYKLRVYNRTADKAAPLVALGAESVSRPSEAAAKGSIVITMVTDDAALENIVRSEGFMERLGQGGLHLSMSTVSPATSRMLADFHDANGSHYVEAPVFGPPEAAAARKLWICVTGSKEAKKRAWPLLDAMGQGIFDFGEKIGSALIVKICGNFISFTAMEAMMEACRMAQKNEIVPSEMMGMLSRTMFTAPVYQNFGKYIALHTEQITLPGLPNSWIAGKDMGLFKERAVLAGTEAPLANLLYDLFSEVPSP